MAIARKQLTLEECGLPDTQSGRSLLEQRQRRLDAAVLRAARKHKVEVKSDLVTSVEPNTPRPSRAVRVLIIPSQGFDHEPATRAALNEVWTRFARKGARPVDFTFRSDYRDDHAVERSAQPIHQLLGQAKASQPWINKAHIIGMQTLQASKTRTREWLSIESPDAIVLLESGAHDEWLDPYRNWARDNGVTVISKTDAANDVATTEN